MKTRTILALSLLLVVLSGGCISGAKSASEAAVGYPGVNFLDFYPVARVVPAGSMVTLYYTVQNTGYFDATDVKAMLFNCGDINDGGSHSWTGSAYKCNQWVSPPNAKLNKPDLELGVAGEVSEAEVSFKADGEFPKGRTPHTFSARVEYGYQTTASRDVIFTTFDNWKEKGGSIEAGILNKFSNPAPVHLEIQAPPTPIIITREGETDIAQEFTVAVQIRNTGGGYIPRKTMKSIKLCYDPEFVEVVPNDEGNYGDFGYLKDDCLIIDTSLDKTPEDKQRQLELIGLTNQWRDVDATFKTKMKDDGTAVVQVQDIASFESTIEYRYYTDKTTQIMIVQK